MYNRYINSGDFSELFTGTDSQIPPPEPEPEPKKKGIFDNIRSLFAPQGVVDENGEKQGFTLDLDTIFLLVLVYFLIADTDEENITETLLIVGALVFLGF